MKVAVIGGGSTYTPELVDGFLDRRAVLPVRELCLMDTAPARLQVVGGLARRMVARRGQPFEVTLTTDRRDAIRGADYVITQLRVGQMGARLDDERLGRRHGLVGQETTGVGGLAKALRTVPVILSVAADMRELAPGALLVNFTNPAGLVTEALRRHAPDVPAVGVCNGPIHMRMDIMEALAARRGEPLASERGSLDTLGLNHLGWYRGFTLDGVDVWPEVLGIWLERMREEDEPAWDPRLIESLGVIPNAYLRYFYDTARTLAEQEVAPPRAEVVMDIEAELLREYGDPAREEPPPGLLLRGGAWYSTVATQLINAHHNDLGETHIVNVRHGGAVAGWDPSWVLEMPARIDRAGIHPLPAQPLPPALLGLMVHVKMYELLAVEAAVGGDPDAAYQALIAHPLGPSPRHAQAVLHDLMESNRQHLPWARAGST
jgi:6-phospho-beta-glucosidase